MKKRIPFNVNDNVWVRLTNFGRDDMRRHWEETARSMDKSMDDMVSIIHPGFLSGDPVRMQMHQFMEYFGPSMAGQCHGNTRHPFEMEMEIEIEVDEEASHA